jgi:hypothetical protein
VYQCHCRPEQGTGGYSPASHCGASGSMWDLWWTEWPGAILRFPIPIIISPTAPLVTIHSPGLVQ